VPIVFRILESIKLEINTFYIGCNYIAKWLIHFSAQECAIHLNFVPHFGCNNHRACIEKKIECSRESKLLKIIGISSFIFICSNCFFKNSSSNSLQNGMFLIDINSTQYFLTYILNEVQNAVFRNNSFLNYFDNKLRLFAKSILRCYVVPSNGNIEFFLKWMAQWI
jgi:hypothetical protein